MAQTLLARSGPDRLTIEQRVGACKKNAPRKILIWVLARFGDDLGDPRPPSPNMQS